MPMPVIHRGTLVGGTVCGTPGRISVGTVAATITCPACRRKERSGSYAQCVERLRGVEYRQAPQAPEGVIQECEVCGRVDHHCRHGACPECNRKIQEIRPQAAYLQDLDSSCGE